MLFVPLEKVRLLVVEYIIYRFRNHYFVEENTNFTNFRFFETRQNNEYEVRLEKKNVYAVVGRLVCIVCKRDKTCPITQASD